MTGIRDQSDPILRNRIKKARAAIIPVGSIEQHGPHLPVSTDSDIISEISRRLAKRMNFLLLPTINYGVSFEHAPFFELSVQNKTLRAVLVDLCVSLQRNGVNTIFIINGHHGNLGALKNIDEKIKIATKHEVKVFVLSYWHFMQREFDHAGVVETSIMLAISKSVNMRRAKPGLVTDGMDEVQIRLLKRLASKSFPKATKNGVWGDPTKATYRQGRMILSEVIRNLQKKCQTCLID